MNYFDEAEKILSHRTQLQKALDNLKHRKVNLLYSGMPNEVTGLDTSKPSVTGGMVTNTMQECLDLAAIQRDIVTTEAEVNGIDEILKQLAEDDCKLLTTWYIDGMSKEEMLNELHVGSRSTLYESRSRAIKEFAVLYFGAGALRMI